MELHVLEAEQARREPEGRVRRETELGFLPLMGKLDISGEEDSTFRYCVTANDAFSCFGKSFCCFNFLFLYNAGTGSHNDHTDFAVVKLTHFCVVPACLGCLATIIISVKSKNLRATTSFIYRGNFCPSKQRVAQQGSRAELTCISRERIHMSRLRWKWPFSLPPWHIFRWYLFFFLKISQHNKRITLCIGCLSWEIIEFGIQRSNWPLMAFREGLELWPFQC